MPSMANLTVKDSANADVVYVAKVPSAGDKTPARWTADAISGVSAFRPSFVVGTRDSANGSRRLFEVNYAFPVTQTVDGIVQLVDKITGQANVSFPKRVDVSKNKDAYVQFGNLLVQALIRSSAEDGYAPT